MEALWRLMEVEWTDGKIKLLLEVVPAEMHSGGGSVATDVAR